MLLVDNKDITLMAVTQHEISMLLTCDSVSGLWLVMSMVSSLQSEQLWLSGCDAGL